jgi:hypothetical protein
VLLPHLAVEAAGVDEAELEAPMLEAGAYVHGVCGTTGFTVLQGACRYDVDVVVSSREARKVPCRYAGCHVLDITTWRSI